MPISDDIQICLNQVEYFSFDDGNWLETLANNTKIKIGGITFVNDEKRFHGSIHCLQIYNVAMNEAEVINKTKCPDIPITTKSSPCPEDFNSYRDKCLKVIYHSGTLDIYSIIMKSIMTQSQMIFFYSFSRFPHQKLHLQKRKPIAYLLPPGLIGLNYISQTITMI